MAFHIVNTAGYISQCLGFMMLSIHLRFSFALLELQGGFSLSFLCLYILDLICFCMSGFSFWEKFSVCPYLTCVAFPLTFPWLAGGAFSEDTFSRLSSLPDKWFASALILVLLDLFLNVMSLLFFPFIFARPGTWPVSFLIKWTLVLKLVCLFFFIPDRLKDRY